MIVCACHSASRLPLNGGQLPNYRPSACCKAGMACGTRCAMLLRAGDGSRRQRRQWTGMRPCRQDKSAMADRLSPSTGSITYVVPSYCISAYRSHIACNGILQSTPVGSSDITHRHCHISTCGVIMRDAPAGIGGSRSSCGRGAWRPGPIAEIW